MVADALDGVNGEPGWGRLWPTRAVFVASERILRMTRFTQSLQSLLAFIKAGPGGKTLVTHHHLHKD